MGTAILQKPATGRRLFTAEEYLARERAAEFRSDYDNGDIFPMAGASA